MNAQSIGHTRCQDCRGSGKKENGTPCASCNGTGLVSALTQPSNLGAPPQGWPKQRRFPRYRTDLPLRVRDHQERDLGGRCMVIAEGGLGGILPEPIPVGSVVQLWFAVPSHPVPLEAWAIVRYQLDLRHGFQFVSLKEEERLSIRQFCNELAMQAVTEPVDP